MCSHLFHNLSSKTVAIGLRVRKYGSRHRNQRLLIIPRILPKFIEVRNVSPQLFINRALNPKGQQSALGIVLDFCSKRLYVHRVIV